jgi:uroporphyrinogen decarboxylase
MIHSCGSSSWAFDDFIQMGIKVVDTLQPEATDMSPSFLKERYGGKLAFHGCISTAGVLAYGTTDEVTRNVRETLEVMKSGGGYILAPTHSIQDNTPIENVIAMFEAARKYGVYGI